MSRIDFINDKYPVAIKKNFTLKLDAEIEGIKVYTSDAMKIGQVLFMNSNGTVSGTRTTLESSYVGRLVRTEPNGDVIVAILGNYPSNCLTVKLKADNVNSTE